MPDRVFSPANLFLSGGTIYDAGGAPHSSMLVQNGRVAAFDVAAPDDVPAIALYGRTVLAGFCDAHLHHFALIDRLSGFDCSPFQRLDDLLLAIRDNPGAGWLRASGYDLGDAQPDRHDLDRAAPHRPVRLVHRSGHLAVVNSAGLAAIPANVLARGRELGLLDLDSTGELTGLIWEPGEWFSNAVLPPLDEGEIDAGLRQVEALLLSQGITAVHDASPANDRARYDLWRRLRPAFRLLLLPGERHLAGFADAPGEDDWLRLGPVKVVLPDMAQDLPEEAALIERLVALERPVAIHAVIHEAVRLAVRAAGRVPARIEHGAEWPDDALAAGITAVMHPNWVRERARRYLESVPSPIHPWLHRARSLIDAGVTVWFGSDFPAGAIDPWGALATAETRRAADGTLLNLAEAMTRHQAMAAATGGGRVFSGLPPLTVGGPADFQVLTVDPYAVENLAGLRPEAVYVGGRLAWTAGNGCVRG